MKLSFHGASRTVTGSKHVLSLQNGKKILLDCGLFQGLGQDTEKLNDEFGFNPKEIDVLLLSHAHIDHSGLIPKLVKDGFSGKIICTEATKDLSEILLYDSAEIQTYETDCINKKREAHNLAPYQPLYTTDDVAEAMKLFEIINYNDWRHVLEDVEVLYTNAGHLIGSAAITLKVHEQGKTTVLLFSADVGRYRSVLLQPPSETPQADYIILESTYGDKHHDIAFNTIDSLQKWIKKTCIEKKGKLIIPAFSVGRTQEVLYALNQLSLEKRLPELLYFIDSPLSLKATETIKKHKDQFNERLQQVLRVDNDPFHFPGLKHVENVADSKKLVEYNEPCVIISASGTADAGRVRHHINSCIANANNTILLVGYCGSQSLGGQLLDGIREVDIFGDACAVKAEINQIQGMSAHGDSDELCRFISCQNTDLVKSIFLVHGDYSVQKHFASRLELKGFKNIEIPTLHQEFVLLDTMEQSKVKAA